uniref:Uncharacterized protein n=1 Tax=viral metagenome TaxID=1070528 RepID=A0A6H1ZZE1_9ZZZZ
MNHLVILHCPEWPTPVSQKFVGGLPAGDDVICCQGEEYRVIGRVWVEDVEDVRLHIDVVRIVEEESDG